MSQGDLFDALPEGLRGGIDILLVNAPYVPSDEIRLMPMEARLYENHIALDGGADGLVVHRRVAAQAVDWLAPGGHLLVEVSTEQANVLCGEFTRAGLLARLVTDDEDSSTVLVGTRR